MSNPETKDTYVWRYTRLLGETWYAAIKHEETRTGWHWTYSMTTQMQNAWQGPMPTNHMLIKSNLGVPLDLSRYERIRIRVTTTVHFELIRPEVKSVRGGNE